MKFRVKGLVKMLTRSETGLLVLCSISGVICLGLMVVSAVEKHMMYLVFAFAFTTSGLLRLLIGKTEKPKL